MTKEETPSSGSSKGKAPATKSKNAAPDHDATVKFPATEDPSVETKRDDAGGKKQD